MLWHQYFKAFQLLLTHSQDWEPLVWQVPGKETGPWNTGGRQLPLLLTRTRVTAMGGCEAPAPVTYSEDPLTHLNPYLFEVSILDQLHSFLCILQVHSLAHAGLGMGCGQSNQGFQRPGCHWRCLGKKTRGLLIHIVFGLPIIATASVRK